MDQVLTPSKSSYTLSALHPGKPPAGCRVTRSAKHLHVEAADDDDMADTSLRGGDKYDASWTQQHQERSAGLRCLAATPDGRVLAGFQSGHLKCYTGLGRLLWRKVNLIQGVQNE